GYCWAEINSQLLLNVELKVQTKSGKPATSYGLRSRVPLGNAANKLNNNPIPAPLEEPPSQEATWDEGLNAPQAFSHALLNIPDVDSADAGASSLCICHGYQPYLEGCDVTGSMRRILVDWLETPYMTVGIIDRFLQDYPVPKSLQLVGVTSILIAFKYEEIALPVVEDFAHTTDVTYSCAEIRLMEMTILKLQPVDYGLAKYLLKLTLLDYASVHYPPSLTAAAAIALSSRILHDSAGYEWTPALQHYMGYTEVSLLPVMQFIAKMLERLNDGNMKQLSIKQKYENVKLLRVSCLPEMTSTRFSMVCLDFKKQD
uniref:Cyclin B1 n=1 Tax=Hucho hucho TaxID=62062 RepID=A0A4W5K983_9TELE